MIALTTPAVVAIAVHWEVLCLLIVMIVDVVGNSSKTVGLPGLVVVLLIEVLTAVKVYMYIISIKFCISISVHGNAQIMVLTYGWSLWSFLHCNHFRRVTWINRIIQERDFTKKYKIRVILVGKHKLEVWGTCCTIELHTEFQQVFTGYIW